MVVPALDEAGEIELPLRSLAPLRTRGHEVVVADGGSRDGTPERAAPLADLVIGAPRSRARQMNAGAAAASGGVLLFLHADTRLPPGAELALLGGMEESGRGWGRFDLRLTGRHPFFRWGERWISWRSRVTGVATGDQAIFVRRELFEEVGGYPDLPLLEDVALSKLLKRRGPPLCLRESVVSSSRRWEERGILRTAALMNSIRLAYALGVSPGRLARWYK